MEYFQIIGRTQRVSTDIEKEKLCLIEDVFKVKKLLFGFGCSDHEDAITRPGEVFDNLMELSIDELQYKWSFYQACASQKARELINWK